MANNKDYLSQEEIDALLRQSSDDTAAQTAQEAPSVQDYLSDIEQDALGEIGNITFGSAATALSTLLGKKVDITTPKVDVIFREQLHNEFPKPHVAVHVNYVDGFHGINLLVIKTRDAQIIADLMMGGDGTNPAGELNEIHISAVQEAMNQMMGSSATSMSTIFNRFVNISPPGIDIMDLANGGMETLPNEEVYIKVSFRMVIGDLIDSSIMQLLPVKFASDMVSTLMGGTSSEPVAPAPSAPQKQQAAPAPAAHAAPAAAPAPQPQQPPQQPAAAYQQPQAYPDPAAYQQPPYGYPQPGYGQPGYPQPPMMPPYPGQQQAAAAAYSAPNRNVNVQPVQFTNFNHPNNLIPDDSNLNLLLDIPLRVTVELGRTQKVIKDILDLSQGSIIELDKLAGEPVDILVNNKLIAKGEVVVIDENFGVRVTDIINQWDRIQKLQ
ncbi:flagellar motor switch phosphatase FliY [Paenibacillus mesotrionivorans]|uniref:Flagellar motor switch phosphatase FliY n=1 Tax=Paenibacillus mesotrionivorans TaxID=3160968 RepID=A0ACC7NUS5_9BACL